MKAVYTPATEENPTPSRKTKMVQYLGTKDSAAYKEMLSCDPTGIWRSQCARRNEMSAIREEAHCLDKEVSVAQSKQRQRKQAALTMLVGELVAQVQTLVDEIGWIKRQFL